MHLPRGVHTLLLIIREGAQTKERVRRNDSMAIADVTWTASIQQLLLMAGYTVANFKLRPTISLRNEGDTDAICSRDFGDSFND